jgi:spoIIIJ-associated protein
MDGKSRDARASVEYSAKTLGDALKRASEELQLAVEELDYEVLRDTTHSILGFVRTGEILIRVWPPVSPSRVEATEVSEVSQTPEPLDAEPVAKPVPLADALEEEAEYAAAGSKGNPPELEKISRDVVATLLDKMGILAAIEVADRGGQVDTTSNEISPLILNLVGDDLGMLIGRRGETLRDLQFIARLIISRRLGVWPNVVIDVENYKTKRVTALESLARRIADQVRTTRKPVALEPMPASERRIIHLALRDDPDVYTESTGQDEARKVQILPK